MTDTTNSSKVRRRRRFDDQFKRDAVALLRSSGASATEVGAEIGVGPSLLSRWAREFEETDEADRDATNAELRRENLELRKEVAFLKKVSNYFASRQTTSTGL